MNIAVSKQAGDGGSVDRGGSANPPAKLNRRHLELFQLLVTNPAMTQREAARKLGLSESWVSIVVNTDMFQQLLSEHEDMVTSHAFATKAARTDAAVGLALDHILRHLEGTTVDAEFALDVVNKLDVKRNQVKNLNGTLFQNTNNFFLSKEEIEHAQRVLRRVQENTPPLEEGKPQISEGIGGLIIDGHAIPTSA